MDALATVAEGGVECLEGGVSEASAESCAEALVAGYQMSLLIFDHLQAVLNVAQKGVVSGQRLGKRGRDEPRVGEPLEEREGSVLV